MINASAIAIESLSPPERLRQLAKTLRHLAPDRHRPERFHEQKSTIEHELRQLAAELERSPR